MVEAFRGEFYQKVDSKARVSIPASFRRVLEAGDPSFDGGRPKVVMVYGGGGTERKYVECYTVTEMRKLEQKIRRLPLGSAQRRALERNFITLSQVVEVDDDGRIVLPPKVRERMGLSVEGSKDSGEACFAGALDTFQLWNRTAYDVEMTELEKNIEFDLADGADLLSLLPAEVE